MALNKDTKTHIRDLDRHIREINGCDNLDVSPASISFVLFYLTHDLQFEAGSRMIVDAVLLTLRRISKSQDRDVAILPDLRLGHGTGVKVTNPDTGYELRLTGNVDFGVVNYENIEDYAGESEYHHTTNCFSTFTGSLVGPGGARATASGRISHRFCLIEAKRTSRQYEELHDHAPEAVGQAVALLKTTK